MGFFGNNRPRHKKFDYLPRYYDPAKEALQERLKTYDPDSKLDPSELAKARIKSGLRAKSGYVEGYRTQEIKKSNYTLLIVIVVLSLLTYLLLSSEKITKILEAFTN